MGVNYRNKNRGYQQLRVWQDAIQLYGNFPFELKKAASQAIASSISENKQETGDWIDHLVIKESNVVYG